MNRDDITLLFQYNDWANDRILDSAAKVTRTQISGAASKALLKTGEHVEWLTMT